MKWEWGRPNNKVCVLKTVALWWSVQFSRSVVSDSLWPHGLQHTRLPCPSPTPGLLKLMSIESVMPSNHLVLCCPLLLLPSIVPNIRVFSIESALCIRWPEYWSFSFSFGPSNEYSGLISFKDWLGWSPCSPRDCRYLETNQEDFSNGDSLAVALKYVLFLTRLHAQPVSQARLGILGPFHLLRFLKATWIPWSQTLNAWGSLGYILKKKFD